MRKKTTLIVATLLVLGVAGLSFAAEIQGADAQKELQKFQGTWVLVSGEGRQESCR